MSETILGGRYRLLERIGEGGMALVYRAEDTLLGRVVAIKVPHADLTADPDYLARFRSEAQAAAALTHPNIVNVYDVGQDGGEQYIVMEYVAGPTLKQVIQQRGPLPLGEALDLAAQICAAAEVAHRRGIVHRDLKPQNVLVADGVAKVADFGLAQPSSGPGAADEATVLGSAHYMSPEQAQGGPATPASDVYAIGVILYEMLTGRLPYDGATAEEVLRKQIGQAPIPPRQLNPNLPTVVEGFVYKALAKDPAQRFATARELGSSLTAYRQLADGRTMPVAAQAAPAKPVIPQPANGQPARAASPRPDALPVPRQPAARQPAASLPRRPELAEREHPREGVDWLLAILVLITLACIIGLVPLGLSVRGALMPPEPTPRPTVNVPNLIGQPVADAEASLRGIGLVLAQEGERWDTKLPAGRILAQTQPSGSGVPWGSSVGVVVSKGVELVEEPAVTGLPVADAAQRLTVNGFAVVRQEAPSTSVASGLVISQEPPALSRLARGAAVTLTVSLGNKVQLPDLMGKSEADAQETILGLGLVTTYVNYQRDEDVPASERWRLAVVAPGCVLSQTPGAGKLVDRGTIVYLAVRRP